MIEFWLLQLCPGQCCHPEYGEVASNFETSEYNSSLLAISLLTMSWTTAWADNESNVGGFDGSSHSLLQSIYGSQTSQILLSGRQSEAQLVIEEADEDGWSDDDRVTGPVRPSSSQGSLSAAVQRRQTAARPKTAAPHPSHSHYRPTPVSSSTSLISTGSSRGARGMARSSSAVQNRSSSGRSQVHAVGQEQKPVRRRPMSAAVPRSYSMQGGSRRSSLGGGSVGQSQAPSRPRPKSAFVVSHTLTFCSYSASCTSHVSGLDMRGCMSNAWLEQELQCLSSCRIPRIVTI